jgi:hypothetical protein
MAVALRVTWASADEYLAVFNAEISKGGLLVRGATLAGVSAGTEVSLEAQVGDAAPVKVTARIAAVVPGVGVAVMFDGGVPPALAKLAQPSEEEDDAPRGPLTERLKAMSQQEKMQLSLSGGRDERTALLRDNNKSLHLFVLKNPRIGLDEVQAAARMPNLSPDALKMIAEHRDWSVNPTICTALVRNPKTPMPLALRLIDRVPPNDLRAIAKGGARDQIVHAARKKIAG